MQGPNARSIRFGIVIGLLLIGGLYMNVIYGRGEARVERRLLEDFPEHLGEWKKAGRDTRYDSQVENILRADDYLARTYSLPGGQVAHLYVGYYATQRTGATYHSPLNCLPGSGWSMSDVGRVMIQPANGGAPFEANRYIVENGGEKQLMIYWYQGRGRVVASEYWGKIYTVIDSMRMRRSDGAIVRVMVPAGTSDAKAQSAATGLAALAAPELPQFVPD